MTVLVGGLRVLGANTGVEARRVHEPPGTLSNDFFVNLLDMGTEWKPADVRGGEDVSRRPRPQDRRGEVDRHARRPGLRLELAAARAGRGLCQPTRSEKFVKDFVAAWTKVMNLDRFDQGPDRSHGELRRRRRDAERSLRRRG
jgi:catalase-peroxidase